MMLLTALSAIGSIASVVGLILAFSQNNTTLSIRIFIVIISLLTVSTAVLAYKNSVYESVEYQKQALRDDAQYRKDEAAKEAKKLLKALPSFVSQYNEGDSQGIILSGVAFLEKHKGLYPDSYELIKTQVLKDLDLAKENRGSSDYGVILHDAAIAVLQVLRGIAGPNES